jgi:hypothetical protein
MHRPLLHSSGCRCVRPGWKGALKGPNLAGMLLASRPWRVAGRQALTHAAVKVSLAASHLIAPASAWQCIMDWPASRVRHRLLLKCQSCYPASWGVQLW